MYSHHPNYSPSFLGYTSCKRSFDRSFHSPWESVCLSVCLSVCTYVHAYVSVYLLIPIDVPMWAPHTPSIQLQVAQAMANQFKVPSYERCYVKHIHIPVTNERQKLPCLHLYLKVIYICTCLLYTSDAADE